jgi:hypothetical protein
MVKNYYICKNLLNMKRVLELKKQNSSWEITTTHTFKKRLYEISENGDFYSNGKKSKAKPDKKQSIFVRLIDDNGFGVRFKIHQIVGQCYLNEPIKDHYSIDHIDRNRLNNHYSNLRVASRKTQYMNRENVVYKQKTVFCLNNREYYDSCLIAEAALGLPKNTVSAVCRGVKKSIRGYKFIFPL